MGRIPDRTTRPTARLILAAVGLLWLATVAGCTSDDPSAVGSSLGDLGFDLVLQPLNADQDAGFAALSIEDPDIPVNRQEVLYLGEQGGTSSSILVNFDFTDIFSEDFPESLFTDQNIKSVRLSLTKLKFYGTAVVDSSDTTGNVTSGVTNIYYSVRMLDAPFDTTAFPGPVPPDQGVELVKGPVDVVYGNEPLIPLYKEDFLAWLAEGGTRGFIISAAAGSDPGLVGFASRELDSYNELADVAVGTVVAPNFVVDFDSEDVNFLMPPVADTSTFDAIGPVPENPDDRFVLRTGLRSYPVLRFDFSGLPAHAFINRAVLAVTNDTTASFGNFHSLVISELPVDLYTTPADTLTLAELGDAAYVVTGQTSLDPTFNRDIRFDVTQAVQRMVNQVYEGERALVMTAGEDFAPLYDQGSLDPEFYFSQFDFLGFAAPDSLRPHLEITYSLSDSLVTGGNGGGQ